MWACFNAKEHYDIYSYFPNIDYVLAEVHDHEKWPLPDKHGCTAISMETDIQELWVWSHSKGLIWKSALVSGCSEQEENGLQTGESDTAKAEILSVPRGFQFRLRAKVITIQLTGSLYSHIYTFKQ